MITTAPAAATAAKQLHRILCVDDEQAVLAGLELNLYRHYDVTSAISGRRGLEILAEYGPFAVVISDMRMPGMDGAHFLSEVRRIDPDAIRILLTGHADVRSAVAAINEGQIFRFLTKPCPPATLHRAIEAGIAHRELVTAERVLREETLRGSIQMMLDVLALANPGVFGHANRIRNYAVQLAEAAGATDVWRIEIAAMLSQIGAVTLDPQTVTKLAAGQALSSDEVSEIAILPVLSEQLLRHVPRVDDIRLILRALVPGAPGPLEPELTRATHVIRIAIDFELLESQGVPADEAVRILRGDERRHERDLVETFATLHADAGHGRIRTLSMDELQVGMSFAEDVRTASGVLFFPRGYTLTPATMERLRRLAASFVGRRFRVNI